MTDNEIIKALECCGGSSAVDCYDCPLKQGEITHCTTELATNALDLIDRQKAEIERLKDLNPALECESKEACDMTNKCGSCEYAVPATFGKSHCYVECTNKEHIEKSCKREISLKRQRTHPACRCYAERKEDEGK